MFIRVSQVETSGNFAVLPSEPQLDSSRRDFYLKEEADG